MAGEARVLRAFVDFAESVAAATGPVETAAELARRAEDLFAVDASAVFLAQPGGTLRAAAWSGASGRRVAELEIEQDEGPAHDAVRIAAPVVAGGTDDPEGGSPRWPHFAPLAARAGLRSFAAVPLRRRGTAVGAVTLGAARPEPVGADDLAVAQAFADVAALAITEARAARSARVVAEQLQTALDARVVIEQAKGIIAQRSHLTIEDAFTRLRRYSRGRHQLLTDVARRVVDGALDPDTVVHPPR